VIGSPDREAESEAMDRDCAEPDVQRNPDWIDKFVADEMHPLELLRPASTLTTAGGCSGPSINRCARYGLAVLERPHSRRRRGVGFVAFINGMETRW
jgi:hypothetical protein